MPRLGASGARGGSRLAVNPVVLTPDWGSVQHGTKERLDAQQDRACRLRKLNWGP